MSGLSSRTSLHTLSGLRPLLKSEYEFEFDAPPFSTGRCGVTEDERGVLRLKLREIEGTPAHAAPRVTLAAYADEPPLIIMIQPKEETSADGITRLETAERRPQSLQC